MTSFLQKFLLRKRKNARSSSYSVLDFIGDIIAKENQKRLVILLYAIFALTLWKYIPSAPQFADAQTGECILTFSGNETTAIKALDGTYQPTIGQFLWNARKLWGAFVIMGVIPALIVKFVFREKLADYGLTFGQAKRTLNNLLLFCPFMILIGWLSGATKGFYDVYPFNPLAGTSWLYLIVHSLFYFFLYYLAWEFMFRGFIQIGLTQSLGVAPAVLFQVVASTMLHYGHPASEVFGCIAGGFLWGFLVYRTKSIFAGWGQHALLGIALDWSLILKTI